MSIASNEVNTYTNSGDLPVLYGAPNSTIYTSPPPEAAIYYYGGHGTDLCDPDTHLPITDIVPPGCIYVTIAVCGEGTHLHFGINSEENFFRKSDAGTLAILRNPGHPLYKRKFAEAMHVNAQDVHIKYPGERYVRSHLGPFGYWFDFPFGDNRARSALAISGLVEKKKLEHLDTQWDPKVPTERFQRNYLTRTMIGIEFLKQIGRWYNHDQETIDYAKQVINEFMKEKKKVIGRKNLTIHTFRFKPDEGNFILSKIDTFWFIDEIIEFYNASVYPTAEEMREFFHYTYPGRQKIFGGEFPSVGYQLEQTLSPGDIVDPNSKLSNTYLMNRFPGIHYNVVCRETHPKCIVAIQRSSSLSQDTSHYPENVVIAEPTEEELKPFLQSMNDVRKGRYRSFTQKKLRIRNKLLQRANLLTRMTNNQRQNILNTLKRNHIVNEQNNNTQKPISKTIKHILFPKRYPITKGGTRKRTKIDL